MKVRLLRNWGQYPKDRILEPPAGQADMMIFRNIAIRVSDPDEPPTVVATKRRARKKKV